MFRKLLSCALPFSLILLALFWMYPLSNEFSLSDNPLLLSILRLWIPWTMKETLQRFIGVTRWKSPKRTDTGTRATAGRSEILASVDHPVHTSRTEKARGKPWKPPPPSKGMMGYGVEKSTAVQGRWGQSHCGKDVFFNAGHECFLNLIIFHQATFPAERLKMQDMNVFFNLIIFHQATFPAERLKMRDMNVF